MNTLAKIAIAAGAGLVAGGVLGVLFAPDKGENTRKKITDSGKKLTDTVKEKMGNLKVNIRGKTEAVKEGMEEFA
ncbi:YtxH domain-containing protein [Lacibacter sediminis]|uniref:YtxH domain-containing protein n=1 Tax=Lacibacter sediminis TaxID=2760713 RepID=A0A7G5XJA7_9BACT|nr:YtxH domain-containing protein [Lacibacter sediminis]QNA45560.1 YtxH domain-containing protein [Lacibacter sediminis]